MRGAVLPTWRLLCGPVHPILAAVREVPFCAGEEVRMVAMSGAQIVGLIALILLAAGLFVAGLCAFVFAVFRRASGIGRLAERFAAAGPPAGPVYDRQTVQVGAVRWRNCVTIGATPQGLYLALRPAFPRYPPLLVPWSEIKGAQTVRLYWRQAVRLTIGAPEVGSLTVLMPIYSLIYPYLDATLFRRA